MKRLLFFFCFCFVLLSVEFQRKIWMFFRRTIGNVVAACSLVKLKLTFSKIQHFYVNCSTMNCRRLARMWLSLSRSSRDHRLPCSIHVGEHFFPDLVRLLFLISLFVLFVLAAHSLVRALSGVFFFVFVGSSFYLRLRRRSVSCVSCLFISIWFSRTRLLTISDRSHTKQSGDTRSRCGILHAFGIAYFVIWKCELRASRQSFVSKLTYIPFSVVNAFPECRRTQLHYQRDQLSAQYIRFCCSADDTLCYGLSPRPVSARAHTAEIYSSLN